MKFLDDFIDAVRQELGLPKKVNLKEPICNLKIDLTGWQKNYSSLIDFVNLSEKMNVLSKFYGDFRLLRDGSLVRSPLDSRFHTHEVELDLRENFRYNFPDTFEMRPFRDYNPPHLHFKNNGKILGDISPDSFDDIETTKLSCSPFSKPHYTLNGLYFTLPDMKMNTKIEALQKEILYKTGYKSESIATRKETRLKVLENTYKRKISDQ